MAKSLRLCLLLALVASGAVAETASVQDTPVTRVTNLLKDMTTTLQKEMDEDEAMYKEMTCWCNNGNYEKTEAIDKSNSKIQELRASIESLTAGSAELSTNIKELEADLASNKQALAEATGLREKQQKEFQKMETDSIKGLENMKAALEVLSKHQDAPDQVFKKETDSWSFLEMSSKSVTWTESHEAAHDERMLAEFNRENDMDDDHSTIVEKPVATHKFLQQAVGEADRSSSWSVGETAVVKRAMASGKAFLQSKDESAFQPSYTAQTGEIVGIIKQMKDQMAADLDEAQKREQQRAADFQELRMAKKQEITDGDKMAETKEDELAQTDTKLAESKEDLEQETKVLAEDTTFLKNLGKMCGDADNDFNERKEARLAEMQAVSDTIEILQGDEARDAMSNTFKSFVQVAASRTNSRRTAAAVTLRRAASRSNSPELYLLATSVELDAFSKVKQAIDTMISALKLQQEDEVKKHDWCNSEIQENEMTSSKAEDHHNDLVAKIEELESVLKTGEDGIADAQNQVAQLQLNLQTASLDRKKENLEFQTTVSDQIAVIAVLHKALDRLSQFYDLAQTGHRAVASQTPPQQKEYKKNAGGGGVMEMIEKLISDSKQLQVDSQKGEAKAQAAYEQLVADTNGSVEALQKEIVSKTEAKTTAKKDKHIAESDLKGAVTELSDLAKSNGELHQECDYLVKNFDVRQKSRGEEVESLQQAKQILNGATMN